MENIVVSICCQTYNHKDFIAHAIDSFLMQKTNFKFEILLRDDASSDGTSEIVKDYYNKCPDIISPLLYEENQFQKGIRPFADNVKRARGKYIAICEGDDYWTDPYKLQKQVDFLERNEECSICWTKYKILDKNKLLNPEWENSIEFSKDFKIDLNNIFTPYCTYTLTTLFRKSALDYNLYSNLNYTKDNTLYAICLTSGNGMLLDFYSGVYRLHDGGVYSLVSDIKRYYSYLNLKEIVSEIKGCNNKNLRNVRNGLLIDSFYCLSFRQTKEYINIIIDGLNYLGYITTFKLVIKKILIVFKKLLVK